MQIKTQNLEGGMPTLVINREGQNSPIWHRAHTFPALMFYYGCISYLSIVFLWYSAPLTVLLALRRLQTCMCWFWKNYTYRPLHILYAVLKTQGTLSRYHRWEVANTVYEVEVLALREQNIVTIAAGPQKKLCSKPYVSNALAELNSVLASISKTV
jgi:hypothetical protein